MNTSLPPAWPHCADGAGPADPVGCRGIQVNGHTACLAHLPNTERDAYLTALTPGASIDHRGTTFSRPLLRTLLFALRDPATGTVRSGKALFSYAVFESHADFSSVTFEDDAQFRSVTFKGGARFDAATFKGAALFESATFADITQFESATFKGAAQFRSATFTDITRFEFATFEYGAGFRAAAFKGAALFDSATFASFTWFESATFERVAEFESATFKGGARFGSTTFAGATRFRSTTFEGDAWFVSAIFKDGAGFGAATFKNHAWFQETTFEKTVGFGWATFENDAWFEQATFESYVAFGSATFAGTTRFDSATFKGSVGFGSATFEGDARFTSADFVTADRFGPLMCAGQVVLSGAVFGGPVTLSFAARRLVCRRTRWSATAEIRLRYARVDFADAVFEYPLTIAAEPDPFVLTDGSELAESVFAGAPGPGVRVASLRGVDAAHLVLADVDLSVCLFAGTVHLDQLRLEGACTFDAAPSSVRWRRWPPVRFTERRVLAEEHHWRATQPGAVRGWNVAVLGAGRAGPLQLAPVYRALRKAFEDGKHEPGAADFYYGEMEMRRHAGDIPRTERGLLTAYWALSGYGLRASRALAWLGAAMFLTIVLLMAFGLAQETPKQTATGTVPAGGGKVTFEIDKDDPRNPDGDRFTGERFEKALNITLNSVVFRSSGQDLTTAGTYIEMTSRLTEPVLLGLAVLAVRNRVKR
ncbi:pentapeptide repeat-containing protein [Streptomyces griseus]|uniref:pentapeptide repeat-containing protein n=1 Tax=Streptomyces griseus TaxID=1911 RepID=UPI0037967C93